MGDLDKLIVAKGFKKSTKVQKITKSGHTVRDIKNEFMNVLSPAAAAASFSDHH